MDSCDVPKESTASQPDRTLKIKAGGDRWKGFKPKIRLMGHWLEHAGFKPGTRVSVRCIGSGVIELRSMGEPKQAASDEGDGTP